MLWLVVILAGLHYSSSLKILSVFAYPQKSHHIIFNALLEGLVVRGHDVTVYSGHRLNTNLSNYRHYHIKTRMDDAMGIFNFDTLKSDIDAEPIFSLIKIHPFGINMSDDTLCLQQMRDLLASDEKFDVILLETLFAQEALVGLGYRFNAPVVTISTLAPYSILDSVMGNPNPLAYLSSSHLPYNSSPTFLQRVRILLLYLSEQFYSYYYHLPHQQEVLEKHFKGTGQAPLPSLMDMLTNMAVVLMNIQPEVSHARAFVPNMISVGGMHIPPQRKPLPQKIRRFMDESDQGVIYFSLGSTIPGSSMPDYMREALVTTFKSIPQRVIWKIEEPPSNLPTNVMTVEWAPQADILDHPNCKGFITHGGVLSLLEAIHFAVPVIGFPLFADQAWNLAKFEQDQIGIKLRISSISHDSLSTAIKEILHNSVYKRNMDQRSAQMRDRLVSPLDTAVYWVEYVAKHQGAPHLRSPARNLSFFHYFLIDVSIFLLSVTFFILLIFYFFFIRSFRFICLLFCKTNKYKNE